MNIELQRCNPEFTCKPHMRIKNSKLLPTQGHTDERPACEEHLKNDPISCGGYFKGKIQHGNSANSSVNKSFL